LNKTLHEQTFIIYIYLFSQTHKNVRI